jgi:hypothetical protein
MGTTNSFSKASWKSMGSLHETLEKLLVALVWLYNSSAVCSSCAAVEHKLNRKKLLAFCENPQSICINIKIYI